MSQDNALLNYPYTSQRMPVLAQNVVATSQPLAAAAGLQMFAKGGNAMDAALATAICLTVVEPCMNGIGGDAFAIVWDGKDLHGMNSSGRAPAAWSAEKFAGLDRMPAMGWDSVTTPGVVAGWRSAWEKFGSLPFEALFEPAIRYAREGFIVSPTVHRQWQSQIETLKDQPGFADAFIRNGAAPQAGERFICPGQAETLEQIAATKGDAFYKGELADAIVAHAQNTGGVITKEDLAAHKTDWADPIRVQYRDVELCEIGPNGQGIGALMALGILDNFDMSGMQPDSPEVVHLQIEAMKLAFADLREHIADPDFMKVESKQLLHKDYLAKRAALIDPRRASVARAGDPHTGGTVYLTAADKNGMMVSFIQSNFKGFGSGVVVPNTGIALQNRGWGFSTQAGHPNVVGPNKRPFHTIIPGFVMKNGKPLMSFGVMGGAMQAQGHLQVTSRVADFGFNAQAASDAPRWRVKDDNSSIAVEWNFPAETVEALRAMGHDVEVAPRLDLEFGSAQIAMRRDDGYAAASDHRKDGLAIGY